MVSMPKKRGKLSNEEMDYIREHSETMPISKIAENLNRTEAPVKRFIKENAISATSISDDENFASRVKKALKNKVFWKQIVDQLEPKELSYFEEAWVDLMRQFQEDVTATEESQIKRWIITEILLSRCMSKQKQAGEDLEHLNGYIKDELKKKKEDRDEDKLMSWHEKVGFARSAIQSFTNEYVKLQSDYKSLTKDIKGARDQRVKNIKDAKTSFQAWLRAIQDEAARRRQGEEAGLMKLAKEKAWQDISQEHTYCDDKIDRPLLNAEVLDAYEPIKKEDKDE